MKNKLDAEPAGDRLSNLSSILLALSVAPHISHINGTVMSSFYVLVAFKLLANWHWRFLQSKWVVISAAIICFSNSAWIYGVPLGRDPGVSFLIVLLGLKILESRSRRDVRIVLIIGYFIVVTHFLYFAQLVTVTFLCAVVLAITWLMIQTGHVKPKPFGKEDLKLTLSMFSQAIPFALILFFLFPRFSGFFGFIPSPSQSATTGMSDVMSMGTFSDLAQSEETAFTATFESAKIPPTGSRYWRAGVFWFSDGRNWARGPELSPTPRRFQTDDAGYSYQVELEPSSGTWLYSLDQPESTPKGADLKPDAHLTQNNQAKQLARYRLTSHINYRDLTISQDQRSRGVEVFPDSVTPRMEDFVTKQVQSVSINNKFEAADLANSLMRHFNTNEYVYTLQPPMLLSQNPVDEFLFDSKQGFCEHYASTFATLLRVAGVPSRVVVGYLGGEYNPVTDQIVVTQSDAHAWTEFWDETDGWVRADPTAAIAPERINNSINIGQSLNEDGHIQFISYNLSFLENITREARWYGAFAKLQWNRWFVRYSNTRQKELLERLGIDNINPAQLIGTAFFTGLFILLILFSIGFRRSSKRISEEDILYKKFCQKLAKIGLRRPGYMGAIDFKRHTLLELEKISHSSYSNESLVPDIEQITSLYYQIKYGKTKFSSDLKTLKKLIKKTKLNQGKRKS